MNVPQHETGKKRAVWGLLWLSLMVSGCQSTGGSGSASVYYGAGYYHDPWYWDPVYIHDHPPEGIGPPPSRPDNGRPKPSHPIAAPPRPMPRPAARGGGRGGRRR